MITKRNKIWLLVALLLLINNGCIEYYKISTTVNADGSFDRTIMVFASDSATVFDGHMQIPTDSSWQIKSRWIYPSADDTISEKKFEYIATKRFKNIKELNEFLDVKYDTSIIIQITCNSEKKFRWFYTYHTYTETYLKSFPFDYFKAEDYFTEAYLPHLYKEEFTYIREKDSLSLIKDLETIPQLNSSDSARMLELEMEISKEISGFIAMNIYEEFYNYLISGLEVSYPEKYSFLKNNKDILFQESGMHDIFSNDNIFSNNDPLKEILKNLKLSEDSVIKFDSNAYKVFNEKLERTGQLYINSNEIKNSIAMPGLLLETNADSFKANQCFWNFNEYYFYLDNYLLFAKSRTLNIWAFILTGAVFIYLIFYLVKSFRKKS
ncbi:MAG: hypothetical protein JXB34_07845 [Bacteroidales bacterium]|nr:hypothetical protein [Bacteroidales bacterium]